MAFNQPKSFAAQFFFSLGEDVKVAWTNCSHSYIAKGKVCKVNEKTYVVALSEGLEGYPHGHKIKVPKFGTPNNRLYKLEA
jgi:hypothetical protein